MTFFLNLNEVNSFIIVFRIYLDMEKTQNTFLSQYIYGFCELHKSEKYIQNIVQGH